MPILRVSFRRDLYECMACGKPYIVDRVMSGAPVRPYCTMACKRRAEDHWDKFNDAYERAHQRGELSTAVRTRLAYGKMSPLCPRCGKPFVPNTTLHGQRKRGRPRKYCSDACRKEAYEQRWKANHHYNPRGHRHIPCLECGEVFDRDDMLGRRVIRFCSPRCTGNFTSRAYFARKRMVKAERVVFRRGVSGQRAAILGSKKNRERRALRNTKAPLKSGEVEKVLCSDGGQVQGRSSEMGILSISVASAGWEEGAGVSSESGVI
jgi:hypothetical protein